MQKILLYRKVILSFAMTLCLILTFTVSASAHPTSVPHKVTSHKATPQATGGGCGAYKNSSSNDISGESCINFDGYSQAVQGDTYITFRPTFSKGYVSGCYVQTILISNHGQYPGAFLQQNCVGAASDSANNAYFGVVRSYSWGSGDSVNTVVNVKITYSSGAVSVDNNILSRRLSL